MIDTLAEVGACVGLAVGVGVGLAVGFGDGLAVGFGVGWAVFAPAVLMMSALAASDDAESAGIEPTPPCPLPQAARKSVDVSAPAIERRVVAFMYRQLPTAHQGPRIRRPQPRKENKTTTAHHSEDMLFCKEWVGIFGVHC